MRQCPPVPIVGRRNADLEYWGLEVRRGPAHPAPPLRHPGISRPHPVCGSLPSGIPKRSTVRGVSSMLAHSLPMPIKSRWPVTGSYRLGSRPSPPCPFPCWSRMPGGYGNSRGILKCILDANSGSQPLLPKSQLRPIEPTESEVGERSRPPPDLCAEAREGLGQSGFGRALLSYAGSESGSRSPPGGVPHRISGGMGPGRRVLENVPIQDGISGAAGSCSGIERSEFLHPGAFRHVYEVQHTS